MNDFWIQMQQLFKPGQILTAGKDGMRLSNILISRDKEDSDEDSEEVVLERTPRKIKTNTCNCNICTQARVCLLNYYTHECNDPLAQKFKDSITHTCQTHNLVI